MTELRRFRCLKCNVRVVLSLLPREVRFCPLCGGHETLEATSANVMALLATEAEEAAIFDDVHPTVN